MTRWNKSGIRHISAGSVPELSLTLQNNYFSIKILSADTSDGFNPLSISHGTLEDAEGSEVKHINGDTRSRPAPQQPSL